MSSASCWSGSTARSARRTYAPTNRSSPSCDGCSAARPREPCRGRPRHVIRLAVRVRRDEAELVLAELLELSPGGVEEADVGEHVEYAVYGPAGELPSLPELRAAAGDALVEVATTELADDWQQRWRRFQPRGDPG